jgi:DNA-binding NarL/FixJ family response regulator
MLPDGDGTALLDRVRAANPHARIAITTGVLDPDWLERARAWGPATLLRKPIDMKELLRSL